MCYKICYLLFAPNFFLFRKIDGIPFAKSKIQPGLNFSAQNDVRVGLQWKDVLRKCSSKLLRLFGLHWASKGGKMV